MAEELGKIERPLAGEFGAGRKLFYVPLIFTPMEPETDLLNLVDRYWDEVGEQVANLEAKLGDVAKVYHEMVPVGGEDGANIIEELNAGSYKVSKKWLDNGADLEPIEEADELAEFMDWSKCMLIGMQSVKVATKIFEFYRESQKLRIENISKRLDETLKEEEIGVLLMREGHQVQYPSDVKVFYVAPPSLDEIHRWMRAQAGKDQAGDTDGQGSG